MKKIFIFISLILLPNLLLAEPKQLECVYDASPVEEGLRLKELGEYDLAKICESSDFSAKYIFQFDTRGLQNATESLAEKTFIYACGVPEDTAKVSMTHTPSVISFDWSETYSSTHYYTFNVDRKTLKAGYDTKRNFTCSLKDIDTSENIL